ncbi:MAG: biliverdin-producing heme oxygenase [Gammaproteobacteria bacterium]|nr:biliverdin-producing heme oxygenase [Gammaproteobacteria bacterium]
MGLLATIHVKTKQQHEAIHEQPFLLRYRNETVTLLDHYRHLSQLLPIYETLEKKLKAADFALMIPEEFNELLNRSEKIKSDMACISPYIMTADKDRIFPATQNYVKQLDSLEPRSYSDSVGILGHYLVRILGDLFGGQKLKDDVLELFKRTDVDTTPLYPGIKFYTFPANSLRNFSLWLNTLILAKEDYMIECANDSFKKHALIFQELETSRDFKPLNGHSFFEKNKKVILGTAALICGGMALGSLLRK